MTVRLLLDNGSSRPESTLALRRLAERLESRLASPVQPVSLKHADKVPAERLDGRPAQVLAPFLQGALEVGHRDFLAIPLFFGPSAALGSHIPEVAESLARVYGPFRLRVARELCPLPPGEPRLADILVDQVRETAHRLGIVPRRVVLVDHGSPSPRVGAVRAWLTGELARRLGRDVRVAGAAMERRPGAEYDFNGDLLETTLLRLGRSDPSRPVILAMLFLAPGRHAGPDGDIAEICRRVCERIDGFRVYPSPLVGTHPDLLEILAQRAGAIPR